MSDRIRQAIEHLYRATDLSCGCRPSPEITATSHVDEHITQAIGLLEEEVSGHSHCANCNDPLEPHDAAYRIQKGSVAYLLGESVSKDVDALLLCPRCYDNNWIIGGPDGL